MTEAPKSLRAFYGARERPQEILTPQYIIDKLPWVPECDPCSCEGSLVPATVRYFGPPHDPGGLVLPWVDRTFFNPPYKDLKLWLARAVEQDTVWSIGLVPVRTHRKWFREALNACTDLELLNPLKFVGYEQAFPAPLCLMSFGGSL